MSSGTSNASPAVTSNAVTPSRLRNRRARKMRSARSVNSGKLAKPSRPTATVDTWIAAKKLSQWTREHDAVGDEPHVEGRPLAGAQEQDAERDGGDRRAPEDDRDRRQRQPLAEEPREAEERDGCVHRDEGSGVRHAMTSGGCPIAAVSECASSMAHASLAARRLR